MDEDAAWLYGILPGGGTRGIYSSSPWGSYYEAGKLRESYDMFGRIQAFSTILNADRYVMVARGIFKEDTKSRPTPGMGAGAGSQAPLTEADKKAVRDALTTYLKPYLRG